MSATLTPAEIAEIVEYTREHPEIAAMFPKIADPRIVLKLIRDEKEKSNEPPSI